MAWETKTKTPQQEEASRILTPDGCVILVGSAEDETLIYKETFNNWSLKEKVEQ